MNNIVLKAAYFQWKNPVLGQPSRAVEEHYYARRIVAVVNGIERQFRFTKDELPYTATEDQMIAAIDDQVKGENTMQF